MSNSPANFSSFDMTPEKHLSQLPVRHRTIDYASSRNMHITNSSLPIMQATIAPSKAQQPTSIPEQASTLSDSLVRVPSLLELPLDHPRPKVSSWREGIYPFTIDADTYEKLSLLRHFSPVSLCTTLLATFVTLLFRYTGQEDLLIGTPRARSDEDQAQPDTDTDLVMVPIHCRAHTPFLTLMEQVDHAQHEARTNTMISLVSFIREMRASGRDRSRPLCQLFFQFDDLSLPRTSYLEVAATNASIASNEADIALILTQESEKLSGRFIYNSLLFEEATIARMAGHLRTLLYGVSTDAQQIMTELPLLTEEEQRQILVEWNATSAPYNLDCCIHEHFEAQVARTPDAVAVVFLQQSLTYRELNQRANQLAHHLQRLGVGPEILVGLFVDRSIEMIIGMLGVLKAGGAYVPIDPNYPRERLVFLMQDAQPRVLLTQAHLVADLPATEAHIVSLDSDWETISREDDGPVTSDVTSRNLAYVIYTSGSTGTPKGVEIWHRSLVNYITYARELFDIRPNDHFLQFASISFDASAEDIYPCLTGGATLYIRHDATLGSIAGFLQYCEEWGITKMQLPTAFWHELVLRMEEEALKLPASFHLMIIGGERAVPERVRSWRRLIGQRIRLLNTYGPTEATITSTAQDLTTADLSQPSREVSIGRPVANTCIYLLDAHLKPVPIGIAGEMYIGGANVGRGYLRRPELTTERFVPDPFSKDLEARLYKTGDLARYSPNGEIEYLGRTDHQVKVRGFRIELGEVEAALNNHPAVRETAVMAREDEPGNQQLVAYIVFSQGQNTATNVLQDYLKAHLPPYMVPTVFVTLSSFPLTINGKVDRKALPPPKPVRAGGAREIIGATTEMQHRLVRIWEDLLQVHPISIRDNFFTMGGHSLLAIRMLSMVEQLCGQRLPMSTLFEEATIEHLAEVLAHGVQEQATRTRIISVQHGGSRPPFFFLHGAWKEGAFYCLKLARAFGPEQPFYALDPYRFEGLRVPPTFEEIVATHIEDIRQVQPKGPYIIGGFCNGAVFACEVANQLRAAGENVPLLILINADALRYHQKVHELTMALGRLFHLSLEQQLEAFLLYEFGYRLFHRIKRKGGSLRRKLVAKQRGVEMPKPMGLGIPIDGRLPLLPTRRALHLNSGDTYDWVVNNYTPRSYPGKAVLLWTHDYLVNKNQWIALTDPEETEHALIRGTHITCRTRRLDSLSEHLCACLEKAQEYVYGVKPADSGTILT
jgi:amino acid adenylation domain-containing protein